MLIPKAPATFPLKSPLSENDPVSVPPEAKHEDVVVKVKFATVTSEPLLWVKDVVKANAGELSAFVRVAVQFPLILPEFEFPPPHPARTSAKNSTNIEFFMEAPKGLQTYALRKVAAGAGQKDAN
jgi:hypothetical protein